MVVWRWLVENRGAFGRATALVFLMLVPTVIVGACLQTNPDWSARTAFPSRVSDSVETKVLLNLLDDDGKPVDGGQVNLMAGWFLTGNDLSNQLADDDALLLDSQPTKSGVAELTLPTRTEIVEKLGAVPENVTEIYLATVAEYDSGRRVEYKTFTGNASPRAILTLDRPLYQPGQTIKARVLLIDRDSGSPIVSEGDWKLSNSEGQVLARRKTSGSDFGIASVEFPLSQHIKPGRLKLDFLAPNLTISKQVTVKPYRLPRFKVVVEGSAEPVQPGATTTFLVRANYTYGSPLVGVEISFQSAVAGVPQVEQLAKSDEDGKATFEVAVPDDAQPGALISGSAKATSDTGRAESGSGSAHVAGRFLNIEMFPTGAYKFTAGIISPGFVVVTDGQKKPVVGATVRFAMGEQTGERESETTTDANGIANFEWTAFHKSESQYIIVDVRTGTDGKQQRFSPPVGTDTLRLEQSVMSPGETLAVSTSNDGLVLLAKDGLILAVADASDGSASLPISKSARGLASVLNYQNGNLIESKPIWIQSGESEKVEITPGSPNYRPGQQAEVLLKAPGSKSKTAFGLIGVDEALYALAERNDAAFTAQARGVPTGANTVMSFLMSTDLPPILWTARFLNGLQHASIDHGVQFYGSDITKDVRMRRMFWLSVLILLMLVAVIVFFSVRAGGATVQAFYVDAFSWRRAFGFLGISVVSAFVGFGFGIGGGEFLAGGMAVWAGVLVCWLTAAAIRNPEVPLGRWMTSLVFLVFTAGVLAVWLEGFVHFESRSTDEYLAIALIGIPAGALVLESAVWCFLMLGHGWKKAAFGLVSIVGAVFLGITGGGVASLGTSSMKYEMSPSVSSVGRFADVSDESFEREEKSGKKMRNQAKTPNKPKPTPGGPRVRSWFPETMVFLPEISGDGNEAVAKFEVPDSITTWRLNAYANSLDGDFASGQKAMTVVQPLFVELDVPGQIIDGDSIEVAVTVVNDTNREVTGELKIDGDQGLDATGSTSLTISSKSRTSVFAKVAAKEIGLGKLKATFVSNDANTDTQDAVERPIRVVADGRSAQTSVSTFVRNEWIAEPNLQPNMISGSLSAHLRLFPNVASQALDGIESMLRLPNGCFEQTSSANYPNVLVYQALKNAKPASFPDKEAGLKRARKRARVFVELGYQRMLTFRNYDGGFGLYPGQGSDFMLTAYGVMQLLEMKKVIEIDTGVMQSALQYLQSNQQSDGSWSTYAGRINGGSSGGVDIGQARATAFIALALASSDDKNWMVPAKSAAAHLLKTMEKRNLSLDVIALAANVFVLVGDKEGTKLALGKLIANLQKDGDRAYLKTTGDIWFGARGSSADLQVTAQAAFAMLKADLHADVAAPMIRHIAQARSHWGGWGSTQATVWSLRTLTQLQADVAKSTDVTVTQGGVVVGNVDNGNSPLTLRADSPTYVDFDLQNGESVKLTATKVMNFGAHLVATYSVPWSSPADEPFSIATSVDPNLEFAKASQVLVKFRSGAKAWSNVIVELPIGPGGYVDTEKLNQWKSQGRVSEVEVGLSTIRLYIDRIAGNTETVFAYEFTPLVKGDYRLPAVRVFPFYNPELMSESQSPKISVR